MEDKYVMRILIFKILKEWIMGVSIEQYGRIRPEKLH
jgi:hypothetical protein